MDYNDSNDFTPCTIIRTPVRASNGRFRSDAAVRAEVVERYQREREAKARKALRRAERAVKRAEQSAARYDAATATLYNRPFANLK